MQTCNNNTNYPENILSAAHKKEVLKRKQSEIISHINGFFDIGGLEMPCGLLKDLLSDYTEYAKNHPHAVLDYDAVTTKVYYTMEMMSFVSILYQLLHEVKSAEKSLLAI